MTIGAELSNPTAFGSGQTADSRSLFLDIFGGEVITAFETATITADKVQTRTLSGGAKSARFPKTWKATAAYHKRGQEMLGNEIETSEITITPDELLVAHTAVYDMDEMLSHFDIRGPFSNELGRALARIYDQNNFRQMVLSARMPSDGPFPGGNRVVDAALAPDVTTGVVDGFAWYDAIKLANKALYDNDVPEDVARFMGVDWATFDALKNAKDASGRYLFLDSYLRGDAGSNGFAGRDEQLTVDGVTILKTKHVPDADESADTNVYSKYRADYSNTLGVLWTPMTVANVKLRDVKLETERDARRQEDFMVASMLAGHGTLRPETGVEFASA